MTTGRAELVVTGAGVALPWTSVPAEALRPGGHDGAGDRWFDVPAQLGPRGYKYLPPACLYLLAAARRAVADAGGLEHVPPARRGAVLGTNGALEAMFDEMNRTVVASHADRLSPATAPYFAVNVIGSRPSTEHRLQAFAMTLTSPRVAGLEAVQAGARAVSAGRGDLLLVGGMEHGLRVTGRGLPIEQGAAVLVLEPRRAAPDRLALGYGSLAARTCFLPPRLVDQAAARQRLCAAVGGWLDGWDPGQTATIHPVLDDSPVSKVLAEAVEAARTGGRVVRPAVPAGTGCLTPIAWLAGLAATGAGNSVVVAGTSEGNIALAWLAPDPGPARARTLGGTPC
jgi:3-oxoacyl-[acyl-carrier-protein] synthase II